MKIRNGFVSNSSSSSFLIGIAEIADKKLFDEVIAQNKNLFKDNSYPVSKIRSSRLATCYDYSFKNDTISISSFTGAEIACIVEDSGIPIDEFSYDVDKEWLLINYTGDEGDDHFCYNDDLDYDIDESFFDGTLFESVLKWMQEPERFGLKNANYKIGAGRNG